MAIIYTDNIHYKNIADAIRAKNGSTNLYAPSDMSVAIEAIRAEPNLEEKTVTPSTLAQEITPDSGYDGLSKVIINGDADLIAENIKKDVEIFGVIGTYASSSSSGIQVFTKTTSIASDDGSIIIRDDLSDVRDISDSFICAIAVFNTINTIMATGFGKVSYLDSSLNINSSTYTNTQIENNTNSYLYYRNGYFRWLIDPSILCSSTTSIKVYSFWGQLS